MNKAHYGDGDSIAALATARGGALDLIRGSGKDSIERFASCFSQKEKLRGAPGNTLVHGWIRNRQGGMIDEVVVSVYRAPRSYTGEDALDISCHGGGRAARSILERLWELGFREALKGEFTFRAFMHGKLDLTRCESVMELVSAKTERSLEKAAERLSGLLEKEIQAIKELLVELLTETELLLDYSEEDGVSADGGLPGRAAAGEALKRLERLAASYAREKLYQEGALVVIAGRPNAGKSSLFNYLLREERSIVTEIPGTTRDWIEAWISIEGIPVRLADTAGFQDSPDRVERLGMERSRELIARSDLVLYLIDGTGGPDQQDREFISSRSPPDAGAETEGKTEAETGRGKAVLALWNKIDLAPLPPNVEMEMTGISARTGEGMEELERNIVGALRSGPEAADGILDTGIATERQKLLVDRALASVREALELDGQGKPLDLIAPCLRDSVDALGEITGEISTADLLDVMFSRFCVGK